MIRRFKRYQCNLDVERKYSMTWLWHIYANLHFYGGQGAWSLDQERGYLSSTFQNE